MISIPIKMNLCYNLSLERSGTMKNALVIILFLFLSILSFIREPITDSIDALAGATNPTYGPSIDGIAGASHDDDDDDHDDDEDEYEVDDD